MQWGTKIKNIKKNVTISENGFACLSVKTLVVMKPTSFALLLFIVVLSFAVTGI